MRIHRKIFGIHQYTNSDDLYIVDYTNNRGWSIGYDLMQLEREMSEFEFWWGMKGNELIYNMPIMYEFDTLKELKEKHPEEFI